MIGKYQVQLGADQFITGMASSNYTNDGALGTSSFLINPFVTPGIIRTLAGGTDISTNVAGNIIASTEDSNAVSPNNRYMIDDAASAANYYSYNGTAITKVKTGTVTGTTYVAGKSDFISFNAFFYGSSPTVLNKWDGTSGAGLTEAFQTFQDANAHHPMLLYQGQLYIGDGNTLSTLTKAGVWTTNVLVLGGGSVWSASGEKIVALGIDPGTGLMMISVQTIYDISDTIPSLKIVYLYDGIASKPIRKILVDDLVTAFYNLEGRVYVGAGQTIGVWNGSGVTFLRKLYNVALSNTDLPYKHHFTNVRNILLVVDGSQVLAYGAVVTPNKAFYYTAQPLSGTNHLSIVMPFGSNKFGIGYATNKVASHDLSSTASGGGSLYFNNIFFPRPVFIRRVKIITTGITQTSTIGIGSITLFDENNVTYTVKKVTTPGNTTGGFYSPTATTTYSFDFDFTNVKLVGIQPRINWDTQGFGIVRVIIYYDVAE